ncbi:oligosaccharide flippase family protein [Bacteroides graminisolvens]|uniref:oligosaccharide flippase family protein n=1 Tax=Bacteroides graminisolvens TaxID=477666 RepID=UPI001B7FEA7D|nr:oligosaccharide flippase family protein [Bacteroides graminisolvens]
MLSSSNSRQATWVAIGQFSAFAIGVISPMILSRYFTKVDYGTYKQVMYVYNTMLIVFTFGLPKAYSYFIPRVHILQSKDVINKISRIFVILGLIFSLLLFFGASLISNVLNNPDIEDAVRWFSPTPLFLLPVMGLEGILVSYKKAKHIALFTFVTRLLTLLCTIVPVILFDGTYIHSIIGFDIASLVTCALSYYLKYLPTRGLSHERTEVSYKEIFSFSLPLLFASLWIMLFQSTNQFFVSRYYGNEVFAEFSNGFMDLPIIPMVINSVATVIAPIFAGLAVNNKGEIGPIWNSALSKTVKIIYPISMYCILFSGIVMTCLYGRQYADSGVFFSIKSIEGFFSVIPFYPILMAMGKTREYSRVHMIFAVVLIPIDYILVHFSAPVYSIGIAYVFCSLCKVFFQFKTVGRSLDYSISQLIPIKEILKILFISFLSTLIPFALLHVIAGVNEWILLLITGSLFFLGYYVLCWMTNLTYRDVILLNEKLKPILKFIP